MFSNWDSKKRQYIAEGDKEFTEANKRYQNMPEESKDGLDRYSVRGH